MQYFFLAFVRYALCFLFLLPAPVVLADTYPSKPIRLVVPYPPGGTVDLLARILSPRLTEILGQSVIVDNRSGAGGIIGTNIVAKAGPDGYSLLLVYDSFAVNPHAYKNLPYDSFRDLEPVSELMATPLVFLASPKFPVETIRDLVAAAKAKPGTVRYSTGGRGSSSHLTPELFKIQAGIDMTHVPYSGGGPALTALMVGDAQVTCLGTLVAIPLVKGGRLRALAVSSSRRTPQLPEVPTIAESGYPGFEANAWYGLLSPAGVPREIIKRVREAFVKAMHNPNVAAQLAEQGGEVILSSPEQFRAFLRSESAKWGRVVKEANLTIN